MTKLWYGGSPSLSSKKSKSLIHPFVVKDYDGLTINPYQGCHHRCAYCYATYEWSPDFYDKVYAKSNAAEVLESQLARWKSETIGPVMVSSATDCYQPAELRFGLTRKCVNVLQKYNVPYYVFTKSALIERDLELHRRYRDNCFIVWSITTVNENTRRIIEPGTPPSQKLFAAIKKFTEAGVCCGVNVDPIIPLVTDTEEELGAIADSCKQAGVSRVFGAMMRLRSDIWDRMKTVFELLGLESAIPQYQKKIYVFEEPLGSSLYLSADGSYSNKVMSLLTKKLSENGIDGGFPDFLKKSRLAKVNSSQTSLATYFT
ncbi:MAG TPA: radical SAM protein [Nitrososphaera sp.]|nr:radical SAM protein [Nitrososphaera sp.]